MICVQYCGGYCEYRGGYYEYHGGLSWVPWGDIMMHVGGYHDAHGEIMMHVGDIMSTVGGVKYRGGKSSLSSLQWTPHAPYGASYMYGTHHLNNYHHNSKSISNMWCFVWDPFKRCFWAASLLQQTSRVSYGTHLYKCFRAASTLSSLQQTLRVSCGAPYDTHSNKCLG